MNVSTYKEALSFLESSDTFSKDELQHALKLFPVRFIQEWRIMPYYKKCEEIVKLFVENYTFREVSDYLLNNTTLEKHYCPVCGNEIHSNDRRYSKTCSRSCATKLQMSIKTGNPIKKSEPKIKKKKEIPAESFKSVLEKIRLANNIDNSKLKYLISQHVQFKPLLDAGHTLEDIRVIVKEGGPLEPRYCEVCKTNVVHLHKGSLTFNRTCCKKCSTQLMKATCLDKYGVENGGASKETLEKIKQTNLERRGVTSALKCEKVKEKIRQTNLERYGAETPFASKEIREKFYKSNLEKFGSVWAMQNPDVAKRSGYSKSSISYEKLYEFSETVKPDFSREEWNGCGPQKIYKWKCLECGETFEAYINGPGHLPICRKCHPYSISSGHEEVAEYIQSIYDGELIINDRKQLDGKELDIYLPDLKLAFEFDGNFWHSTTKSESNEFYQLNKTKLAESKGIHLIHIYEYEWNGKKELIKRRIQNLITHTDRVFARKCEVKEIDYSTASEFLNAHHIQGACISAYNIGLVYNEELVAVMTFGKPRFNHNYQWELLRFATSKNVIGGASKLLKHFEQVKQPKSLLSYADRKWTQSETNVYKQIGFEQLNESSPSYVYVKADLVISRYQAQKKKLPDLLGDRFDPELSETENMALNNFLKVYDCGNLVFVKNY